MTRVTRRSALAVVGGGAVVAVAGGAFAIRSTSTAGLVRSVLERHLGPVRIGEPELEAFIADFVSDKPWLMPHGKLAQGYELAVAAGIGTPARAVVSGEDRAVLERFERRLLGAFFETTDVGWRETGDDPVSYSGAAACNNPFAVFTA